MQGWVKREIPEKNPPTSGITRHDSLVRKSWSDLAENLTRFAEVGGEQSDHYNTAAARQLVEGDDCASLLEEVSNTVLTNGYQAGLSNVLDLPRTAYIFTYNIHIATNEVTEQDEQRSGVERFGRIFNNGVSVADEDDARHALGVSEPTADLQGNQQPIPYCQVWSNIGYSLRQQPMNNRGKDRGHSMSAFTILSAHITYGAQTGIIITLRIVDGSVEALSMAALSGVDPGLQGWWFSWPLCLGQGPQRGWK
ncbi:hypothetical protein PR048_023108 [Dryococelus australis]|uniref:Uncharacterized protein n=1 Tax=Dryococelus australis TaxID=614101 RepID=A0ABQ9GT59_9NEOP|nr:hypothetical protein PR048_023108 [Dryococelus australis]